MKRFAFALVLCAALLLGPPQGQAAGAAPDAATLALGRWVYDADCATCHGIRGDGRGPGAAGFAQPPTDFTQGTFAFRSTLSEFPAEDDLERSIREGMSGTEMVPFKRILTPRSIAAVAAYLKTFSDKFAEADAVPGEDDRVELPSERPAPPSAESIAAGREVYADNCADCHGEQGEGGTDEKDDWDRPVLMIDFRLGYYKSGLYDTDLYRSIAVGMQGTTMDAYAGELEPEEIWQVVDYIRSMAPEPGLMVRLWRALFINEPNGFDYRGY